MKASTTASGGPRSSGSEGTGRTARAARPTADSGGRSLATPNGVPWIDVHAHPGRGFLRGLPADDPLARILGADEADRALADLAAGHVGVASFSTVGDLRVLTVSETGIRTERDFEPGEAWSDHERQLDALLDFAERGRVRLISTPADIEAIAPDGVPGMLLTCEGGDFLEGRTDRVATIFARGVRSLALVHYRVNELGDIQTEAPVHEGLTSFGAEVVAEMNRLGMIIDLAHAPWSVTRDVLERSTQPLMISHSHLASGDDPHPRLLSREHALAVAHAGGIVGAWPSGVVLESLDDYVEEILRMVDCLGIAHVATGTDMDANYQPVFDSYVQWPDLAARLHKRGLSEPECSQVLGGNFLRLFRDVSERAAAGRPA